ncbi:MAG: sigma factor, partial [Candidatus Aenigmatarchaeota archaeon]
MYRNSGVNGRYSDRGKYSDKWLMTRLQDDDQAFSELRSRFDNRLTVVIGRFGFEAPLVEDIVQETFIRVHRHAHGFSPKYQASTWIYTIALNLARNETRRRK